MWARSFFIKGSSQTPWQSDPSSHRHHKWVTNSWCLSRKLERGTPQTSLEENGPGFKFIKLLSCIKPILCLKAHGMGGMSTNHQICWRIWKLRTHAICLLWSPPNWNSPPQSETGILNAMNNKEVICLVLLDLSVTFDTVNCQLLLNHLTYHFGFKEKVYSGWRVITCCT